MKGRGQRRLVIGILATVGLGAFALVPTDYLRISRPSKPLFLMLIPLVRVQARLRPPPPFNLLANPDSLTFPPPFLWGGGGMFFFFIPLEGTPEQP